VLERCALSCLQARAACADPKPAPNPCPPRRRRRRPPPPGTGAQGHEHPIRCMAFGPTGFYLFSSSDDGVVKIWSPTLTLLKALPAHREPCRAVSPNHNDLKFCTGSDDSTVKIWDFATSACELSFLAHGGDIRDVQWHPTQARARRGSRRRVADAATLSLACALTPLPRRCTACCASLFFRKFARLTHLLPHPTSP